MKIRSDIIRMYRDIHSWVGIVCGLALFIAFYAGAITMFETPLQRWASPPPQFEQPTPLEKTPELVEKVLAKYPQAENRYEITLQTSPERPARMSWHTGPRGGGAHYFANLAADGSLQVTSESPSAVAQLVDDLHRQVGLPFEHEISDPIMGTVSLLYFIALVSGVIVLLPTLVKDLFILRIGKNLKRLWLDFHNALGLFSLPFHIVMSLTAVVFAFHHQFYDAQSAALASGERPPAETHAEMGHTGDTLSPVAIVDRLKEQSPEFRPAYLQYHYEEDHGLELRVAGVNPRHGMRGSTVGFAGVDPYSGELTMTGYMPGEQSGWFATITSFFALHFGNFGGSPVRWGYFFLGLAGAVLFYTGNLLWIESHRKKRRKGYEHREVKQTGASSVLGALTVGVSLGCVAGISLTVAAAKFLPQWVGDPAGWHFGIYYAVFLLATAWAFIRGAATGAVELLYASAAATLAIPSASLVSALVPELGWNHGGSTYLVDLAAVVGALALVVLARKTAERIRSAPAESIWFAGRVEQGASESVDRAGASSPA
ncbi:PepSY-associated TM helix domain-containing protein [Microbulbifer halophilus]|uniref:PepSY-associated TM helix domain-containing protein n=1 Tax=Microbulbifer halophilus TaxID=453963 RepID=A0ABW5E9X8_9GAMM|nr:PepSY-associated TM helix domain-containing protein [Microbulbifer halophilus]MCW8125551.1 PepSY-associated TM helix domain-containing protein [Microbulbifer halophilus]